MKTRKYTTIVYPICVLLCVLFYAKQAFPGNKMEIEISNASVIVPENDSLSNRILFKFDLPSSLNDKRIDYAEVIFDTKVDTSSLQSVMFAGYPISTDWNKASASWVGTWTNNGGDFNDSLGEIGMIKATGDGGVHLDITHLVERWQNQSMPNYGLIIIPLEKGRKIIGLEHPAGFSVNVFAKVIIYFSYTHP